MLNEKKDFDWTCVSLQQQQFSSLSRAIKLVLNVIFEESDHPTPQLLMEWDGVATLRICSDIFLVYFLRSM